MVLMQSSCLWMSRFKTHGYFPSICLQTKETKSGLFKFLLNLSKLYKVAQDKSNPIFLIYL